MPHRAPKAPDTVPPEIQSRLEAGGLRRTLATRAVLGLFLAHPQGSVTHAQAQQSLRARGLDINRVTLYRLLDRLAACGVLQRHADDAARTWHFQLADLAPAPDESHDAPRFECDACHRSFPLDGASEPTRAVAGELFRTLARLGHLGERLELSVHGTCATCVEPGAVSPEAATR